MRLICSSIGGLLMTNDIEVSWDIEEEMKRVERAAKAVMPVYSVEANAAEARAVVGDVCIGDSRLPDRFWEKIELWPTAGCGQRTPATMVTAPTGMKAGRAKPIELATQFLLDPSAEGCISTICAESWGASILDTCGQ